MCRYLQHQSTSLTESVLKCNIKGRTSFLIATLKWAFGILRVSESDLNTGGIDLEGKTSLWV